MGDDRPSRYEEDGKIIYRASALGGCSKALAALGMGHTPEPYPDWLLVKFQQGNDGEAVVLEKLRDAFDKDIEANGGAWLCVDEQSGHQYKWEGGQLLVEIPVGESIVIRGHADGIGKLWARTLGSPFDLREVRLVEVKCTTVGYGETVLRELPSMYAWQISCYGGYFGLNAILVLGLKDEDGKVERIKVKAIDELPYTMAQIKRRVIDIERRIRTGDMGLCDVKQWPCPFSWLCDGGVEQVEGTKDEDLEQALQDSLDAIRKRVAENGE